jgi:hypothetical protein
MRSSVVKVLPPWKQVIVLCTAPFHHWNAFVVVEELWETPLRVLFEATLPTAPSRYSPKAWCRYTSSTPRRSHRT